MRSISKTAQMNNHCSLTHVFKRDGALVPYSRQRITNAIYRAAVAMGGRDKEKAEELALKN